jgi:hypothetical protein
MIQFKRFFVFIYLHVILTVFLTYLSTWLIFKNTLFKEDLFNVLMGVLWVTLIYMGCGLIWGSISSQKKKLLLPLTLYVLVLYGLLLSSITTQEWAIFNNAYVPFTYFIRNIGSRDLWILLVYGLACILPSGGLYLCFRLSYKITHRKDKTLID